MIVNSIAKSSEKIPLETITTEINRLETV